MASTGSPKKEEELLRALLSGKAKPSAVAEHKFDDSGLRLTLVIPTEKLKSGSRELLALLMSDAM